MHNCNSCFKFCKDFSVKYQAHDADVAMNTELQNVLNDRLKPMPVKQTLQIQCIHFPFNFHIILDNFQYQISSAIFES